MARWFGRRRKPEAEDAPQSAVPATDEQARPEPEPEPEPEPPGRAHQAEWVQEHVELIAALEDAGHSLAFTTELITLGAGVGTGWDTAMQCERCGEWYRGPFLSPWRGLSPKRPCRGSGSR